MNRPRAQFWCVCVCVGLLAVSPVRAQKDSRDARSVGMQIDWTAKRPQSIFQPGEVIDARVAFDLHKPDRSVHGAPRNRPSRRPVRGTLRWQLQKASGEGLPLATGAVRIEAVPNESGPREVSLQVPAPAIDGAYVLRVTLSARGFDEVQTGKSFVVIASAPTTKANGSKLPQATSKGVAFARLVDAFDPAKPGFGRRIPIASEHSKPHPSQLASTHAAGESPPPAIDWHAYRVKLGQAQQPHRLVLTTPANVSQEIGVAILSAERSRDAIVSLDSAVWMTNSPRIGGRTGEIQTEWLFWPYRSDSVVVLHNLQSSAALQFSKIEIYQVPQQPVTSDASVATHAPRRLVGPYFAKLSHISQPPGVVDDGERWSRAFQNSTRLIEKLKFEGANSLLLSVLFDEHGFSPSRSSTLPALAPQEAAQIANAALPDELALLFQLCNRDGLALVPELQCRSAIPALELLRNQAASRGQVGDQGILLTDHLGRTWSEAAGQPNNSTPRYNPLDLRVQQAILEVVGKLADNSQSHSSYRGIALDLSPQSHLQLPGLEWGYDSGTLARFARETKLPVPLGAERKATEAYDYLTATARQQWIAWRSRELARFHQTLAARVTASKPDADLFLSEQLFSVDAESPAEEPFANQVRLTGRSRTLQYAVGVEAAQFSDKDRIVHLHPLATPGGQPYFRRSAVETVGYSPGTSESAGLNRSGNLLIHPAQRLVLPNGDRNQALIDGATRTPVLLSPPLTPQAKSLRQMYVAAFAAGDPQALFDSSLFNSAFHDARLTRLLHTWSALPAIRFHNALAQPVQPLIVRRATAHETTWLYVVNATDLPVQVKFTLSNAASTVCRRLGPPETITLREADEANRSLLTFELDAHDIWCCEISEADVNVLKAAVTPANEGLAQLRERIDAMKGNLSAWEKLVANEPQISVPANPGFEKPLTSDNQVPDWKIIAPSSNLWKLDSNQPHSGESSLKLSCGPEPPRLISRPTTVWPQDPAVASVWLRGSRANCRAKIGWQSDDAVRLQPVEVVLGTEWQRFTIAARRPMIDNPLSLQFVALPLDDADIWIDDIQFLSRRPSAYELRQLTKMLSAVNLAWESGRYADCQRLLDSRWGRLLKDGPTEASSAYGRLPIAGKPDLPLRR